MFKKRRRPNYNTKKYRILFIALPILLLCFLSLYFIFYILLSGSRELIENIILFALSLGTFIISILGLYFLLFVKKVQVKNTSVIKPISVHTSAPLLLLDDSKNKINDKTFFDHLSYEIRTPMNGIFGNTKLLKETQLNVEQTGLVEIIESSYENLDAILSKVSLGISLPKENLELKHYTFNIVHIIESLVETFSVSADEKNIVLALYIDPEIPYHLHGDSTKLAQVITNLIDNALAYSSEYATLNIQLEKINNLNDKINIKFTVSDEGDGLDSHELENIKEVFKKENILDKKLAIDMKNLIISNTIIKKMGGKLAINSNKDIGRNFFFELSFKIDNRNNNIESKPIFKDLIVGLALPNLNITRVVDDNLKKYIESLNGQLLVYGYESLFNDEEIVLPDLMFMYHNYARDEGELEAFVTLPCQTVLITSGTLRSRIDKEKHFFSSIVYAPLTMSKILRILSEKEPQNPMDCKCDSNIEKTNTVKITALVVEDNIISQNIIANILKQMNIHVKIASNGKKAYELRKDNTFDIIFMDINMPIMDGFEATAHILSFERTTHSKHIPIIALATDNAGKEKYIKAGMDDFISKPIVAEDFHQMIQFFCIDNILDDDKVL